jgi:hypothetical protein
MAFELACGFVGDVLELAVARGGWERHGRQSGWGAE